MLRNAFLVFLCTLAASVSWATPLAVRYFSYDDSGEKPLINVSIRVTFELSDGETLPKAFIIEENWPDGFTVIDAQWNDVAITYEQTDTQIRWLWGYGTDHETICNGILNYTMTGVIEDTSEDFSIFGQIYTAEETKVISGSYLLRPDDPGLRNVNRLYYTIVPGWNLLTMPVTEDAMLENAKELRKFFPTVFTLPNDGDGTWLKTEVDSLECGMPFWGYWEKSNDSMLTLTGVEAGEDGTELLDGIYANTIHRWRLNNKNAIQESDIIWLWNINTWKSSTSADASVGQAGWIRQ